MLFDLNRCTGCAACEQKCPAHCIEMKSDKDGFLYPTVISMERCLNCGICDNVCPQNKESKLKYPQASYIAILRDRTQRKSSSSGGIFVALAEGILESNGAVYGCKINSKGEAFHKRIDSKAALVELQGSKYVQSTIGNTFLQVKEDLEKGIAVLFTGLPCQVDGLRQFIGKEYDNLYLVDLICHGVSSPEFLKKDLKFWSKGKQIKDIKFRDKKGNFKTRYRFNIQYSDGKVEKISSEKSLYYNMFIKDLAYRKSCYGCRYKTELRVGDITLGDCATSDNYFGFYSGDACSTVLINTNVGEELWGKCLGSIDFICIDYAKEVKCNIPLNEEKSSKEIEKFRQREEMYESLRNMNYLEVMKKYLGKQEGFTLKKLIKASIPIKLKSFYHFIKEKVEMLKNE